MRPKTKSSSKFDPIDDERSRMNPQAIFRDTVAGQFINTLLSVLANGSHELLREEMGLSVYAMASPDLDGFFQTLLPCFLVNSQGIDDHQRLALKNNFSSDTVSLFFRSTWFLDHCLLLLFLHSATGIHLLTDFLLDSRYRVINNDVLSGSEHYSCTEINFFLRCGIAGSSFFHAKRSPIDQ